MLISKRCLKLRQVHSRDLSLPVCSIRGLPHSCHCLFLGSKQRCHNWLLHFHQLQIQRYELKKNKVDSVFQIYLVLSIYGHLLYYTTSTSDFPDSSDGKESACHVGDPSSIPGLGKSTREGIGYPLQYSGLENSMECTVQVAEKSWT